MMKRILGFTVTAIAGDPQTNLDFMRACWGYVW